MERSQEILDFYRQYVSNGMRDLSADQLISTSPAVSNIGTDPTEWLTDRAMIVQMLDAQREALGQGAELIPGDAQAWAEGDLGWVIDQPRLRIPNSPEVQMRLTLIFHRENGQWKGVHQHASIGVPNDQVEAFRGQ